MKNKRAVVLAVAVIVGTWWTVEAQQPSSLAVGAGLRPTSGLAGEVTPLPRPSYDSVAVGTLSWPREGRDTIGLRTQVKRTDSWLQRALRQRGGRYAFGVHAGIDLGGAVPWPPANLRADAMKMSAVPKLNPSLGLSFTAFLPKRFSLSAELTYKQVGIDAEAVDYFRVSAETGLGTTNRDDIEVVGAKVEDCYKKMWVPYIGDMSKRWPEYQVLCDGACSSCQALLAINMETLKAIGDYERRSDFTVVAGGKNVIPDDVDDRKLVLHGNCARKNLKDHPNAIHIEGCPPSKPLLYMSISNGELVHGKGGQMSEYIRPRMAADQPVWRKYVEEQAKKFYGEQQA